VAPLAKADPQNMMLRMDLMSADFEQLRISILKARYREAEAPLTKLVADYKAMNTDENSGPGTEVLYAWLGEAQFGAGRFDEALKSFRASAKELESDADNDDAICGSMTAYVRIGDALMKLGRPAEAEAAYSKALSLPKYEAALAIERADLPALLPMAAAHAGLGELRLAAASAIHNPAEQDSLRMQGCDEMNKALDIDRHLPVAFAFNPANFPGFDRKHANWRNECNRASRQ